MTKKWIPNLLTVINLFAGVIAILLAFGGKWLIAAGLIMGAALFDSLDGRIARRMNATSEFGRELDSLADLISFGVAPATIVYLMYFTDFGWSGYMLAALFPVCGALRLARFNLAAIRSYFVGLPITGAGSLLAIFSVIGQGIPVAVHSLVVLILSGLMVSTIKVPKI